jgi:hypothetical protein
MALSTSRTNNKGKGGVERLICIDMAKAWKLVNEQISEERVNPATKQKAFAFYYNHARRENLMMDREMVTGFNGEMKCFKKMIKLGKFTLSEKLNRTVTLDNGKQVHCFVLQSPDNCDNMDMASVALGYVISGYAYWFFNQQDRDNYFAYLTKER